MQKLRALCCETIHQDSRLLEMLDNMGFIVEVFGDKLLKLLRDGSESDKSIYGCFLARKFLEASFSSLLMKIDPVRFLVLRDFQSMENYSADTRHNISIEWSTDFAPKQVVKVDEDVAPEKLVRALLKGHLATTVWGPAIKKIDAFYSANGSPEFVQKIIRDWYRPDAGGLKSVGDILEIYRGRSQRLFSTLSKGVHLEFVVKESSVMDADTIDESIIKTVELVSDVSFILSHSEMSFHKFERQEIETLVEDIKKEVLL